MRATLLVGVSAIIASGPGKPRHGQAQGGDHGEMIVVKHLSSWIVYKHHAAQERLGCFEGRLERQLLILSSQPRVSLDDSARRRERGGPFSNQIGRCLPLCAESTVDPAGRRSTMPRQGPWSPCARDGCQGMPGHPYPPNVFKLH